jgi:hypothetical protein
VLLILFQENVGGLVSYNQYRSLQRKIVAGIEQRKLEKSEKKEKYIS